MIVLVDKSTNLPAHSCYGSSYIIWVTFAWEYFCINFCAACITFQQIYWAIQFQQQNRWLNIQEVEWLLLCQETHILKDNCQVYNGD